jgi:hypothetical protein
MIRCHQGSDDFYRTISYTARMLYRALLTRKICRIRAAAGILLFTLCFLLSSCGSSLGYSVMLWNDPAHHLEDGAIVRVYIRSNISRVYVVSIPGIKEKVELPLWQLTEPSSHHKAKKTAAQHAPYAHTYAAVNLDGLPVRQLPSNSAKQVYRLRSGEIIRVLYEGEGETVSTGKTALDGLWLRVLTGTGTQGWCFSHNLELFKQTSGSAAPDVPAGTIAASSDGADTVINELFAKKWYPESYLAMTESHHIDLSRMSASFGFDPGNTTGTVSILLPGTSLSYPYSGVTKDDDSSYTFNGTSVKMTVRSESSIVIQYTDAEGKLRSDGFVPLTENIEDLIAAEQQRRADAYSQLFRYGPVFSSLNYGTLVLDQNNTGSWTGFDLLVPSVIAAGAHSSCTISFDNFVSDELAGEYDGVLTFRFSGADSPVNFLYKMTDNGLRLEDASGASFDNGVVTARGMSPIIIFFNRSSGTGN